MSIRKYVYSYEKLKKNNNNNLKYFFKHDVYYDIDGLDLLSKLKVLKEILQIK